MRADVSFLAPHGRISNVVASGRASTSLSWMRLKPSIAEPSNCMPSSKAPSSSAGEMANDFSWPRTSVNQSRTKRTPRSSTVRSTYSFWRSTRPSSRQHPFGGNLVSIWFTFRSHGRQAARVSGRSGWFTVRSQSGNDRERKGF